MDTLEGMLPQMFGEDDNDNSDEVDLLEHYNTYPGKLIKLLLQQQDDEKKRRAERMRGKWKRALEERAKQRGKEEKE